MSVYWLLAASERLRHAAHGLDPQSPDHFDATRQHLDATLAQVFPGQVVLVREQLTGYRPFDGLAILLIEVQPSSPKSTDGLFPSPGVFIVKIAAGPRLADLKAELKAWDEARPAHLRSDNIFVSLDPFPPRGQGDPVALVYGDADSVLGSKDVLSLEEAIFRACRFGQPHPRSITRLLGVLYERLNTHFYRGAKEVPARVYLAKDSRPRLTDLFHRLREPLAESQPDRLAAAPAWSIAGETEPQRVKRATAESHRHQIRRETLGLLTNEQAWFTDPLDFLIGVWEAREQPGIAPDVRRGFSHGDLHGRNVQVAVLNDGATNCALFDYEQMRPDNFIAWDFIKLEVELAVRLLETDAQKGWPGVVKEALTFWRLAFALADEHERSQRLTSQANPLDLKTLLPREPRLAEAAQKLPIALRRLAVGIAELRQMAQHYLGGGFDWRWEYEFLFTWYALRAVLFDNYNRNMIAIAWVGAGVAARRLLKPHEARHGADRIAGEMTHRMRFAFAKQQARSGQADAIAEGVRRLESLRLDYPHVLEIEEELALASLETRQYAQVETILDRIGSRYQHTTAETPSRLGSLWKRRSLEGPTVDSGALREALRWYRQAEAMEDHYFPAINVATLLWMLGDRAAARKQAEHVRTLLADSDANDQPLWRRATEGEALLLLGDDVPAALRCYESAVRERDCTARDCYSMRRQLVWLRPHLEAKTQNELSDAWLEKTFSFR